MAAFGPTADNGVIEGEYRINGGSYNTFTTSASLSVGTT